MILKKIISSLLIVSLVASVAMLSGCSNDTPHTKKYKIDDSGLLYDSNTASYSYYVEQNEKVPYANDNIELVTDSITQAHSYEYATELDGKKYALIDENSKWIEWKVNIESNSKYILWVDYRTIKGDNSNMVLSLMVDNVYPYEELQNLSLSRLWEDTCGEEFDKDKTGNDIKPAKIEVIKDLSSGFSDEKGFRSDYYELCLTAGEHTLRLSSEKGAVLIEKLILKSKNELVSYDEYNTSHKSNDKSNKNILIEAEHPRFTSDSSIYAISDWQDVATTPNDAKYVKLNAIGDTNWCHNGQKIDWEFNVEQAGYYYINIRARQDYSEGMNAYRTLYVDGEIPFKEASSIIFPYNFEWQNITVGKEQPYYIYLDKGLHTISLEVTPGETAEILQELDSLVANLNSIYRKIIIVTGTTVDIYQDYDLENKIPELINSFKDSRNHILEISQDIKKIIGGEGSRASILDETLVLLDTFIAHPYEISGGLATYKTKIEDIASLLTNMSEQALLLDKITLMPQGMKAPKSDATFFDKMKFSAKKFINSYSNNEKVSSGKKSINVWVSTGRDQAQIIKQMINNDFMDNNDIEVELNIVDTGSTLIQAALANKGPDVAINIAHDTPVNLAMRDGLIDLQKYITDDIYNDFYESSWTPFYYGDGIYGIPETQSFDMLFVRNDIFEELGIKKVPDTWDEFYKCLEIIHNNNLMVGIGETNGGMVAVSGGISTFQKLYFQKGNTYYKDNFSKTTFDSESAIDCMSTVCELYTKYGLERQFDFFNCFRTGEMAMGIATYGMYNQIVAAAPEIDGLWSMYPIPGTTDKDGNINRAETSSGTASIILKAAEKNKVVDESWEFIKWWTSSKTQSDYAQRLEGVMGTAARYTPANIEAFKSIKWSENEANAIMAQWEQVYNVREIPGNYYINRSLTSAIRNTISNGTSIRFNLKKYNNDINSEIARKREEINIK